MTEAMTERYYRVKALTEQGSTVTAALKKVGKISQPTYDIYRRQLDGSTTKKGRTKRQGVVTLPLLEKTTKNQVVLVVCTPTQIQSVIAGLQ